MFTKKELTNDEKIDYIYKTLKRQNQYKIFKFIFFVLIIIFIYFYSSYLLSQLKEKLIPDFSKIISPIVKDLSVDIFKDMLPEQKIDSSSINNLKGKLDSFINK